MTPYHVLELLVVAAVVGAAARYVAAHLNRARPSQQASCGGCSDRCATPALKEPARR